MKTRLIKLGRGKAAKQAMDEALKVLGAGGLVGLPTETVYGIAANAARARAMKRLRALKDRPRSQPFTLLIGDKRRTSDYVGQLSWPGSGLVQRGWPGPLTLVFRLPKQCWSTKTTSAGGKAKEVYYRGTIGLRCPDHQGLRKLLREADFPVVAPSANRRGQPPATRAEQVLAELEGELDLILDGGTCRYKKASTVVEVRGDKYRILREGVLDKRIIADLARMRVMFVCSGNSCRSPMAEGLFAVKLAQRLGCEPQELGQRGFELISSGTMGIKGALATTNAIKAAGELGADISQHLSRGLNRENIQQADVIYTMTSKHLEDVVRLCPEAKNKTKCLDGRGDIDDPIGQDLGEYRLCAARLVKAVERRLKELKI